MIVGIKGTVIDKSTNELIIECNGLEYSVGISLNTSEKIPEKGSQTHIYTILIPKEDSISLYGFSTVVEREAFKLLISISGIGPKSALGILSVPLADFQNIILSGNIIALTKLPGVGKKTAERIILELKDKILKLGSLGGSELGAETNLIKQEALSALQTLGYNRLLAEKAVRQVFSEPDSDKYTAELVIKKALRIAMQ
ncbi:MAG: Holliday junction branch migration protein RuvA [Candidatus Kapabacteria bacterium]|nr:Holliday junction branch migration protein RuvA [Candidatus Kapabacteria bacterium]